MFRKIEAEVVKRGVVHRWKQCCNKLKALKKYKKHWRSTRKLFMGCITVVSAWSRTMALETDLATHCILTTQRSWCARPQASHTALSALQLQQCEVKPPDCRRTPSSCLFPVLPQRNQISNKPSYWLPSWIQLLHFRWYVPIWTQPEIDPDEMCVESGLTHRCERGIWTQLEIDPD